jgi:hypothetical protein
MGRVAARPAEPELVATDGDHCTAYWRNVIVNIWNHAVTERAVDVLATTFDDVRAAYPEGVALLGVSRPHVTAIPAAPERKKLSDLLGVQGQHILCIGSVILGDGFVSSAKRTVLSTIAMLARQPCPLRMFPDVGAASRWMAEHLRPPVDAADLETAFGVIESAYDRVLTRV